MANKSTTSPSKLELIQNGVKKLYKVNKKLSIILIVLSVLSLLGNMESFYPAEPSSGESAPPWSNGEIIAAVVIITIIIFAFIAVAIIIEGMISYAIYQATKDKKPSISEAFEQAQDKFWTILWLNTIIFFRILGGLLLLIVPGIRAGLRYTIAPIVLFDENLPAKETANRSRDIAKNNLNSLLVMNLVSSVLFPISYLVYYGSLVTMYPYFKGKLVSSSKPKSQ